MNKLQSDIDNRVREFATDIAAMVREAALQAARAAFAGTSNDTGSRQIAGGRPRRRSAADLADVCARIQTYVKANPGQRIETIGQALSMPTRELTRPMQKLLESRAIRKDGDRRATRYYPNPRTRKADGRRRRRAK